MLTTQTIRPSTKRMLWDQFHECAHRYLESYIQGSFKTSTTVSDTGEIDIVCVSEDTYCFVECKSSDKLAQLHLLDRTIDSLTFDSDDGSFVYEVGAGQSWIREYEKRLVETTDQLSKSEKRKLVEYLKKARQLLLDDCQSLKCAFFRHLEFLEFKKFRAWLMSFRYAMQRLHCCTESFRTGGASELQRGRHFLTVADRYVPQLWSRVIVAFGDFLSGPAIARRRLAAA